MPEPPRKEESEKNFIGRCVPVFIDEGRDKDQAVAICYDMWRKHKDMKNESVRERVLLELDCCDSLQPKYIEEGSESILNGLAESTVLVGDNTYKGVFFPAEELAKSYMTWDRNPVNINHSKDISDEVGFITNPIYNDATKKFKVTPMLNPITEKYSTVNGFISNRFEAGKPPEVSVGVWLDKEFEVIDNGEERLTARNLQGDHLAIVYRGACSPEAGCGIGLDINNIAGNEMERLKIDLLKQQKRQLELNLEE